MVDQEQVERGVSGLASAMKRCAESFRGLAAPMEKYWDAMEKHRIEAVAADPGLEAAVEQARFTDPKKGWLDIAAEREKKGAKGGIGSLPWRRLTPR